MTSLKDLFNLEGRTALVTGACGNLGTVICETISEQGGSLIILDISGTEKFASKLENKYKNNVTPIDIDFSKLDQANKILKKKLKKIDSLNILINNAAFVGTSNLKGWSTNFLNQNLDSWKSAFDVNLTAPFLITQICTPLLQKSEGSSIINVGSIYAHYGPDWKLYEGTKMGNPAAYASSKAGLVQFTKWLSTSLAPHIRANSISPGGIYRNQDKKFIKKYQNKVPLQRMAKENDFKGIIAFLACDASSYITGQDIKIDGGYSAW
jgi:NAD(P)-dependent dehydrogenase (short-subunit alcohol dehydrogenase family)